MGWRSLWWTLISHHPSVCIGRWGASRQLAGEPGTRTTRLPVSPEIWTLNPASKSPKEKMALSRPGIVPFNQPLLLRLSFTSGRARTPSHGASRCNFRRRQSASIPVDHTLRSLRSASVGVEWPAGQAITHDTTGCVMIWTDSDGRATWISAHRSRPLAWTGTF